MNTLQALAQVVEFSLLVAQGPFIAILALAAVGECIKGHTDPMYTPANQVEHKAKCQWMQEVDVRLKRPPETLPLPPTSEAAAGKDSATPSISSFPQKKSSSAPFMASLARDKTELL